VEIAVQRFGFESGTARVILRHSQLALNAMLAAAPSVAFVGAHDSTFGKLFEQLRLDD
jgi:hypothetical protein